MSLQIIKIVSVAAIVPFATVFFNLPTAQSNIISAFLDTENHWAENYITNLYNLGIISGYNETQYRPDNSITRAEITKIALMAFNFPVKNASTITTMPFKDIHTSDWYLPYVHSAKSAGIIQGYSDGNFRPHNSVSRAEALKILLNTAKLKTKTTFDANFPDVSTNSWYAQYINYAAEHNIAHGYEDGKFYPENNLSRAETAKIVYTLMVDSERLSHMDPYNDPSIANLADIYENKNVNTENTHNILVCLMQWNGIENYTSSIDDFIIFTNQVEDYYEEISYGAINFSFIYSGFHTWEGPQPQTLLEEAQAAASSCDNDANFTQINQMILYPSLSVGNSFGLPQVEVTTEEGTLYIGVAFIYNTIPGPEIISHELGHSIFSAPHGNGLNCGDQSISETACTNSGYINLFDVMGRHLFFGHLSAWIKARIGWIESQTITEGGNYELAALEMPSTQPQVLRIPYDNNLGLCIEYRKPIGHDDFASLLNTDRPEFTGPNADIINLMTIPAAGCLLITACPEQGSTALIDTTPNSQIIEAVAEGKDIESASNQLDFADSCLKTGTTFENDLLGVSISFTSDENSANISLELNEDRYLPPLFSSKEK